MKKLLLMFVSIFFLIFDISFIFSASDVSVWQGQYYTGTSFHTGTYEFNFSVYDSLTEGVICYSNLTTLTTGNFGEWKTEQYNVSSSCNNVSKDYYLNININGTDQTPRKRLVIWNFLRKDVDEFYNGNLTFGGILRTNSPLKIKQSIQYTNFDDEVVYNSFVQGQNGIIPDIPDIFNNTLIYLKIKSLVNNYGYRVAYLDNITKKSLFTLSRDAEGRASTLFNLMIVPENKTVDSSFNLCDGNYVDCKSNEPDLLVYDDIESGGSIFANENVTANFFNVRDSNGYLTSSGVGNLELSITTPASALNIKSGSGSGDSSIINLIAESLQLTGDWIGLYGDLEIWGVSSIYSTSQNAFVISDDLDYQQTFRVDTVNKTVFADSLISYGNVTGEYFIGDGSRLTGLSGAYGEMYNSTSGGTLTMTSINTWYNMTGFTDGLSSGWYFNSTANELVCNLSGVYQVALNFVLTVNSNDEIEIRITKNYTADAKSLSRSTFTNGRYQTVTYSYIQNYSAGDRLKMQIRDVTTNGRIATFMNRGLIVNKIN